MKIRKITLTNYRLYKGVNSITFSTDSDKNIFLISGQNGFGKTTFLHSLLWCLYGRLMVDIDDSIRKDVAIRGGYNMFQIYNLNISSKQFIDSYSKEIITKIKRQGYTAADEDIKSNASYAVSIEFADVFIPSIPCRSLIVTRSYDVILEKETVEILIDGSVNELSTEIGSEVFINDFILNKDIARFFFFDSEKIVALAETNTLEEKRRLASAYNEVLGVKKYEDLKKNLENLRLRFRKKTSDIDSRNKLNTLLDKQKSLQDLLSDYDIQIKEQEDKLDNLRTKNESLQVALLREGNSVTLEDLNRLEAVVETTKKKDAEYKLKLKTFLEYAPFAISGQLLVRTKRQLDQDLQLAESTKSIHNQNALISHIGSELLSALNNIKLGTQKANQLQCEILSILNKYKGIERDGVQLISITKDDYAEFISVFNNITNTYKMEFERLADDYRKNKQILERSSRQIANIRNNESDSIIKEIRTQKNVVEKQVVEIESQIRSIYEHKGTINKELATVNKLISELNKKVSLDDNDVKKDIIAEQLTHELDVFLCSLKQEKKYSLEHRIRNTMNALMHKEDFIGGVKVQIIDDGIDVDLYLPNGNLIRKDSLSKGEQQLYATSILKALVDESGIEFPVFIDSPLQKFDKSHSNKIITEFYPTISKQVVLFPLLHKELTEDELEIMKPLVNAAYIIVNDNTCSYFREVDVESLMQE